MILRNFIRRISSLFSKISSKIKGMFKKKEEPSYNLPTIIIFSDNDFYDEDPYISNIPNNPTASDDPSEEMKELEEILNKYFKDWNDRSDAFTRFKQLQETADSLSNLPINTNSTSGVDQNKQLTIKKKPDIIDKQQVKKDLRIKILKGRKGLN